MTNKPKDCPIRHENGNCLVVGGFCTAVNVYMCEVVRNAYDSGRLSALREQDAKVVEIDQVKPLTLEELRQMAQRCEGVYVAHVDGSPVFRGKRYCAAVLDFSPAFGSNALHVHAIYGDRLTLWEDDYGKNWLAYRSKPKE